MEVKRHFASFAEAIREGAKLRPQGRGMFFEDGKTCAFGAGTEAVFGLPLPHYDETYLMYPYLGKYREIACPNCGGNGYSLASVMFHLNDGHQWTREAIADWLYVEEEKLGFVTVSDETEALKPQVGFINNVAEAQAGVLTKRF